jgi:hypothetical protein
MEFTFLPRSPTEQLQKIIALLFDTTKPNNHPSLTLGSMAA